MATKERALETSYEVPLSVDPRIYSVHLGAAKYTTPGRALAELVANSLDADATRVTIDVSADALQVERTITVSDNGRGITPEIIRERFAIAGLLASATEDAASNRMGRFGVGRLSFHRLGALSTWVTIARRSDGSKAQSTFIL